MTSADSIEQQLLRARRALARGKSAQAHKLLTAAGVSFLQATQRPPDQRRELFDAFVELANQWSANGDPAEAERAFSSARTFMPQPCSDDAAVLVRVLVGSAKFQARTANGDEAESQFGQALYYAEEWGSSGEAESVRVPYAQHLYHRRQFRQAAALLESMDKAVSAERHKLYGACMVQQRKYQAAMAAYRKALNDLDADAAAERVVVFCDMARGARLAGYNSEARGHLREAADLAASRALSDSAHARARVLCEEAALEYADNRFANAITLYESAIELMQQSGADRDLEFADALVGLAMSCLSGHRPDPVEALFVHSLRIMRTVLGRRSFQSAAVLSKLSGFYNKQGRFVEGAALFAASESIHGKSHLTDRMMDWSWHFEAALNYQSDKHYAKALKRYKKALVALESLDSAKNYEALVIHIRLYQIYAETNEEALAESSYGEATRILHEMFGFVQPDVHKAAMTMAACFELQDKDEFAESFFILAIAAARRAGSRELALHACEEYALMLDRAGRAADAKLLRRQARSLARVSAPRKRTRQAITA